MSESETLASKRHAALIEIAHVAYHIADHSDVDEMTKMYPFDFPELLNALNDLTAGGVEDIHEVLRQLEPPRTGCPRCGTIPYATERGRCEDCGKYAVGSLPSDNFIRELWRENGGKFHGPNVETGTMPEAKLLPFLRTFLIGLAAVREAERRATVSPPETSDGPYRFYVDNQPFYAPTRLMSTHAIKMLAKIPYTFNVLIECPGEEDRYLGDDDLIDTAIREQRFMGIPQGIIGG